MTFLTDIARPAEVCTEAGTTRSVGIEVEFAAVTARDAARIVQQMFGGSLVTEDPHRHHIQGSEIGDFTCELDTQHAHRPYNKTGNMSGFQAEMRKLFGDISSLVMPCEIICPPVPFTDIARIDALVAKLTSVGAVGTRASPFYAFGAQLNPEIVRPDAGDITATLKAYILLSPWLRAVMGLDLTRRAMAFADPFPAVYIARLLAPDYWPDQAGLIGDYLDANLTRNRELDMLPLFAHLDPALVRARLDDPRIKPRPTYHYRLPDANIGEAGWSLCLEWNRWVIVDRLAADRTLLAAMAEDYLRHADEGRESGWPLAASQWLILS